MAAYLFVVNWQIRVSRKAAPRKSEAQSKLSASALLFLQGDVYKRQFMPCVIAACFLMTTTSVSEFIGSMKKMHMTDKITIPLSVIFRFFPTVKEDAGAINAAMKMRGITPKSPLLMMEYRMVPPVSYTHLSGVRN